MKFSSPVLIVAALLHAAILLSVAPSRAQGIEQLLIERVPVPQPRPERQSTQPAPKPDTRSRVILPEPNIAPVSGRLSDGLNAIKKGDGNRALGIRAGMQPGSLDRKILAWSIALSGMAEVTPGTLQKIARDLPDWPGQEAIQRNIERAIVRTSPSPREMIALLGSGQPKSVEGAVALAGAWLATGNPRKANLAIAPVWRNQVLDKKTEAMILKKAGRALTRDDHRFRMHMLLYQDRITAAKRVQSAAEQVSLARARAATIRNTDDAQKLVNAVAASSKRDDGFLFAQIELARRTQDFDRAAQLLLKAPSDPNRLINAGEWWVERRIVSRKMIEAGKYNLAYRLASEHASTRPRDIIEAEFHAGWYALRFLKNRTTAKRHFEKILSVATRPISLARGHYWLGRAHTGVASRQHFEQAARYTGTFYGQLAAQEIGVRKLPVRPPKPTAADRLRFEQRLFVQAIKKLENADFGWRASTLYRHLARTLSSPGELAILAARAERAGNFNLSLQVGKIAFERGLDVPTLSWPIGAIPSSARIGETGRALAYAIARQESAFNKAAVSSANARGLLQLLPGTAKAVAKRNSLTYSYKKLTRDAGYNATLGSAYLSEQLKAFGNSYILTFIAYNAGPRRVTEWIERFSDPRGDRLYDVIDWIEQIPFTETRNYVQRVMENYQIYKRRISNANLTIATDLTRGRQ